MPFVAEYNGFHPSCTQCVFIKQMPYSCVCGNPKQTNEDLKKYVYSGFNCELFEWHNKAPSKEKYML